jgi:hypothetical protein
MMSERAIDCSRRTLLSEQSGQPIDKRPDS